MTLFSLAGLVNGADCFPFNLVQSLVDAPFSSGFRLARQELVDFIFFLSEAPVQNRCTFLSFFFPDLE